MKRPSRRLWLILGSAGVVLAVAVFTILHGLREPQPLRYRLDLAERGAAIAPATVYYLAADSLALVPTPRHVLADEGRRERAEELVAYLSESSPGVRAPLPAGTRLLHFFEDADGEAVIDMNAHFQEVAAAGIREERLRLGALVRTLAENLDGVDRIRVLIHGRPMQRWGEHLEPGPVLEVETW